MNIIDGLYRICVDGVESTREVKASFIIGSRLPLYAGAPGKVLLAFLSDIDRKKLLDELHIVPFTQKTIIDKKVLRKELQKVREEGIAISVAEYIDMFTGISVPIRNYTGNVVAALACCGISTRFTPAVIEEYSELLLQAARKISTNLGYTENATNIPESVFSHNISQPVLSGSGR